MATKNSNIKSYDRVSVYEAYLLSLSQAAEQKKKELSAQIDALKVEINEKVAYLNELKKSLKNHGRTTTDAKIKLENMEKEVKDIALMKAMSETDRTEVEADLNVAKSRLREKQVKYEKMTRTDSSSFSADQLDLFKRNVENAKKNVELAEQIVSDLQQKIELDEKVKKYQALKEEYLKDKQLDEKVEKYRAAIEELNGKPIDNNLQAATILSKIIAEDNKNLKKLELEFNSLSEKPKADLETFTKFLEDNGFSTVHAEELFTGKYDKVTIDEIKFRKMHRVRDHIVKKEVPSIAITAAGTATLIGAILGSGAVGGETVMFIPVSATPGVTQLAAIIHGAVIGLAAAPAIINAKKLVVRAYHRGQDKNRFKGSRGDNNLEALNNEISLENIPSSKLIAKIQEKQHIILDAGKAKGLVMRTYNRNRIHEIQALTLELARRYHEIEKNQDIDPKLKAEQLKPIYDILANVQTFITNDVNEARTHAMLNCKTKGDTHELFIEDIDIYADMKIYLERIAKIDPEENNQKKLMKDAKITKKDIEEKKTQALEILNGKKFITDTLNFESKYAKYVSTKSQGIAVMSTVLTDGDTKAVLTLADGKSISIPANEIDTTKKISMVKIGSGKTTITYKDGTTKDITKKVKIIPEIETARIKLIEKLTGDAKFVEDLKAEGFKDSEIKKLIERINEWRAHTDEKLSLKDIKNLYEFAIDKINKETVTVASV